MDIPTILLSLLFSLAWPIALFGDFMASQSFVRKMIIILIFTIPFILALLSVKGLSKTMLSIKKILNY